MAKDRNYISTNDFIKDFWHSRTLIVMAAVSGCLALSTLLIVEWFALGNIWRSLSGWSQAGSNAAVWCFASYVIVYVSKIML
jgi:hypothetical protein